MSCNDSYDIANLSLSGSIFSMSFQEEKPGNNIREDTETVDRQEIFTGKIFESIIKYKS